jgi:DNA-directed RNA polymerase specialized sigma24 family protein
MSGKEERFTKILEDFGDRICRLCCCYVRHEEDRRDLLHDVYLRIWSGLDSLDRKSSLSTWIYCPSADQDNRLNVNSERLYRKRHRREQEPLLRMIAEIREDLKEGE